MTTIPCANCDKTIDESDAYMSSKGAICAACNSDMEVDEMQGKGWFSTSNIATLMLVGGGLTCNIDFNGTNYGGLVMGAVCIVAGLYFLLGASKNKAEPAFLRFGRPIALFIAGALSIIGTLLSM